MKSIASLIFLFVSLTAFSQETIRTKARMESVTVYVNQAQMSSAVNATIPKGNSKIEIIDLPSTVDVNSIQVGGRGNFTLLSVNFEHDYISKKQQANLDSLKLLEHAIEVVQLKLSVNQNEHHMLMANAAIKGQNDNLQTSNLDAMSAYFRKKLTGLGEEKLQLTRELKVLSEQKSRVEKQIQNDPSRNLPLGKIILSVLAETAGKADIRLSYLVYNTGWSPVYDIRSENTKSDVAISYKAEVSQNTGVDWDKVKLILSTAMVNRNTVKPELNPQYLRFYEDRPPVAIQARSAMAKAEMAMAPPAADMDFAGSAANYTQLVENTLNKQFEVAIPYTIKSGKPETVEVQQLKVPATYVTYVVPRYDSNGFLLAEVEDWDKYGLIPASGNVYFEGAFVGKTFLSNPGVKEKLKISLGRDERIEAERKELTEYKERRTFGSNIRENFGFEIILRNTRNTALKVRVEDQIPVSQDSAIEVDLKDAGNGSLNKDTGIITWEVEIPANSTVKIPLKYEVKYPKDKKVLNL
jgi:uncharacterized protein (TIGR02231 family)